jgi:hypothetical protein
LRFIYRPGIFTGLVNLSSRPLAVKRLGTSGAVFGLYGLLNRTADLAGVPPMAWHVADAGG